MHDQFITSYTLSLYVNYISVSGKEVNKKILKRKDGVFKRHC